MTVPRHQIRADFTRDTLVVYQAYGDPIADAALAAGAFVPPFSTRRMTWIKPSFLWLMARSNWGRKAGQQRILAVRIRREAFDAALAVAVLTDPGASPDGDAWRADLDASDVRVQWDPERSLTGAKLPHRSIQVGIGRGLIAAYASEWIVAIEDRTARVRRMRDQIRAGDRDRARRSLPDERPYPVRDPETRRRLDLDG